MLFGAHYPDSGIDALLKMRPTQKELDSMGPAFTERWETFYKKDLDKPVAGIAVLAGYERRSQTPSPYNCPCLEECCLTCLPERSSVLAFTLCVPPSLRYISSDMVSQFYPASVGSIHIASGEDANVPADFDPRCLSE